MRLLTWVQGMVLGAGFLPCTLALGDLAEEILDSRWARQTPNRAKRISDRLALIEVPA